MTWYSSTPRINQSLAGKELCYLGQVISAHWWHHQRKWLEGQEIEKLVKMSPLFQKPSQSASWSDTCLLTMAIPITPAGHSQPPTVMWLNVDFANKLESKFVFLSFCLVFWIYQELAWVFVHVLWWWSVSHTKLQTLKKFLTKTRQSPFLPGTPEFMFQSRCCLKFHVPLWAN